MSSPTETVIAQDGDTVDLIAWRRFGTHGMEDAILAANPGLAALGIFIPRGTKIVIPVPVVAGKAIAQNLWGASE